MSENTVGSAETSAKTCKHRPGAHVKPFWFADRLDEDDNGYRYGEDCWRAFLQVEGFTFPIEPVFFSEAACLQFIRDDILRATTVCDD